MNGNKHCRDFWILFVYFSTLEESNGGWQMQSEGNAKIDHNAVRLVFISFFLV